MSVPKRTSNVMGPGAGHPHLLGLSIIVGILLWTGGIVSVAGSYLGFAESENIRYCEGKCICDGGTLDASLMERVCPEGWEKVFARARGKARREQRRLRRERLRQMREATPPEPETSQVPSV